LGRLKRLTQQCPVDVRIRREGFDLQVLADQIGGGRPAPSSTG